MKITMTLLRCEEVIYQAKGSKAKRSDTTRLYHKGTMSEGVPQGDTETEVRIYPLELGGGFQAPELNSKG